MSSRLLSSTRDYSKKNGQSYSLCVQNLSLEPNKDFVKRTIPKTI